MAPKQKTSKREHYHLTIESIRKLKPVDGKSTYTFDDNPRQLCVRVSPGGAKSYVYRGKLGTESIRITIGSVGVCNLDDARTEAIRLQLIVADGDDPRRVAKDKHAAKDAERADEKRKDITVGEAWIAYVTARGHTWGDTHRRDHDVAVKAGGEPRGRGRRAGQGELTYPGLIYPLLSLRLAELDAERVKDWLAESNQRGKTEAAKCFRLLRAFLNWSAERKEYKGIVSENAHSDREVRDLVQKGRAKKLVIQREQLPLWFASIRKISNPTAAAYLQALLLTGARREELAQLRWSDCDFEWLSIHIKDKVSEYGRDIPLTPYVRLLLLAQPRRNEYVFSSPMSGSGYLADPLTPLQKAMRAAGLPNVSPHDLRRSFATLSEWVEVPAGIVAQIMGHSASAIAEKHYIVRPLDLLRSWHVKIESWILEQAGIEQLPQGEVPWLRTVAG